MGQQDSAEYANLMAQRRARQEGLLSGEAIQQYGVGQETTRQEMEAKERLSQQKYG